MPTSTLTPPRPALESSVDRVRRSSSTSRPFALMVAGVWLAGTSLAAFAFLRPVESRVPPPPEAAPARVEVQNASAITLSGPNDVTVVTQVYEANESSGWHRHSGIHAVAVVSGTLTVYDGRCNAQVVVPGRPYVGGQELHLARNETGSPVEMVVTYLSSAGSANSTVHAASPPCPDGRPLGVDNG